MRMISRKKRAGKRDSPPRVSALVLVFALIFFPVVLVTGGEAIAGPDLGFVEIEVKKSVLDNPNPTWGESVTFEITVTNNTAPMSGWPYGAVQLEYLKDTLPETGFSYVAGSTGGYTTQDPEGAPGPELAWAVYPDAIVYPGDSLTITYRVSVEEGVAAGAYTNRASAKGWCLCQNDEKSDSADIEVREPSPDLVQPSPEPSPLPEPTQPAATNWYLAEGATTGGFETWVLVQNPGDETAAVSLIYMTDEGERDGPDFNLPAKSRESINVAGTVETYEVSTQVTSDKPVVAERAMYYDGRTCAHGSIGVTEPNNAWYLPEGATTGGFETWVLVQNPGDKTATVSLTYMTEDGEVAGPVLNLAAGSRESINVVETVETYRVSTQVVSSQPVIAERAVYYNGRTCAHDSIGYTP